MQFDLPKPLSYRRTHIQLQQKSCSRVGRPHHSLTAASRQSTAHEAVVESQDSFESKPQPADLESDHELGSFRELTRRDLIKGLVAGTVATSAPACLPARQAPVAEALPVTSKLPPIGQAAPGTYNLGVAAVRDPGLYRLVHYQPFMCALPIANPWCSQGNGNRPSC